MELTGCENLLSHEDLAKVRLEKKYGTEFEIDKVLNTNNLSGYYTVIAHPAEDPELLFRASVEVFNEGLSDNYVCKLVQNRLSDKISQNLDGLCGIYYIFAMPITDSYDLGKVDMTVEEYMEKCPKDTFTIYINYCPSEIDPEWFYSCLSNALKDLECVSGNVRMYIVDMDQMAAIQEYILSNDEIYYDFKAISEPYFKGTIEYKNGVMTSDKTEVMGLIK